MKNVLDYASKNHARFVDQLKQVVAIQSISSVAEHKPDIEKCAGLVKKMMSDAGLQNVALLGYEDAFPYVYGEWLGAGPGKPTVFLYSHYDVQPVNTPEDWDSEPWTLTNKGGRLFARGSADDKGGFIAQLASVEAWLKTVGKLPVNVKMVVEGEEEIGSKNLYGFFEKYENKIKSDVIVVTDTSNLEVGLPCITYSLRGIVEAKVEVEALKQPVHSGGFGGLVPDPAIALNVLLSRLFWDHKRIPIPGFYEGVKPLTAAEKADYRALPWDEAKFRKEAGMLQGESLTHPGNVMAYEQNWRLPAVTVIAQEASSIKNKSNQVLHKATAIVSMRIVPEQKPNQVFQSFKDFMLKDPPWGVKVKVTLNGKPAEWWMTNPVGPAFEAAKKALKAGFKRDAYGVGQGGSIGFVGPLSDLFDEAPALLLGIEDPKSNAHSSNESLHEGDFKKLIASLANLYQNLGELPDGKVK